MKTKLFGFVTALTLTVSMATVAPQGVWADDLTPEQQAEFVSTARQACEQAGGTFLEAETTFTCERVYEDWTYSLTCVKQTTSCEGSRRPS